MHMPPAFSTAGPSAPTITVEVPGSTAKFFAFCLSAKLFCNAQRGVDLPTLDVTYFTSLSYYILLLFGLRGVFMLFFRENTIDETQMYRQQMGMGAGANPMAAMAGGGDPTKALEAERTALDMVWTGSVTSLIDDHVLTHLASLWLDG